MSAQSETVLLVIDPIVVEITGVFEDMASLSPQISTQERAPVVFSPEALRTRFVDGRISMEEFEAGLEAALQLPQYQDAPVRRKNTASEAATVRWADLGEVYGTYRSLEFLTALSVLVVLVYMVLMISGIL
jgi:uncharacterized membrane protein